MSATRQTTATHLQKRKRTDKTESPSSADESSAATEVMLDYIDRYEHAKFYTIVDPVLDNNDSSDLDVEDLLAMVSQPDEIRKPKKPKEQPRPSMLATPEEKLNALTGQTDHDFQATVQLGTVQVEVCGAMRKNNRPYMEDRYDVAKINGMHHLVADDDLRFVAEKTTREVQKQCVDDDIYNAGTTYMNVAVDVHSKKITTTQLGDGEAWLHWIDRAGHHHLEALHGEIHHPHEPNENRRLIEAGHQLVASDPRFPHLLRLGNGIAVSRALGDEASLRFGLLHQPTVSIKSYREIFDESAQIRIIMGSDGVFGLKQFASAEKLKSFLSSPLNQLRPLLLTKALINATKGREDNASIMVVELPIRQLFMSLTHADESVVSLTVCDGHGTHRVAEKVTQMHARIQQEVVNKRLTKRVPTVIQRPLEPNNPLDVALPREVVSQQQSAAVASTANAIRRSIAMFGGDPVAVSGNVSAAGVVASRLAQK